jgi:2-dehydro-3-deoxy-D-arabinonate dehydratase
MHIPVHRVFRFQSLQGPHLGLDLDGSEQYDLTAASKEFATISTWLALPDPVAAVHRVMEAAINHMLFLDDATLLPPLDAQEVWACGVTYQRSRTARMEESTHGANFYDRVYEAERPEIFFKATPNRVAGQKKPIRIRRDSTWNVPEPELALVLSSSGAIVGYTIGNDVSSRSIEGENPLYLPQAKIYDGCCALGPMITLCDGPEKPFKIQMTIDRGGRAVFTGESSTSLLRRTTNDLAHYLFRELSFPLGVFLFTGTGIVPPDDFTLKAGDVVRITIEGIGTLENGVEGGS